MKIKNIPICLSLFRSGVTIALLDNIYHRWSVTHLKLILGHQSGKWYSFVTLCLGYLTEFVFIRPLVALGPALEC